MSAPWVSVIVCTYNRRDLLPSAARSVLEQRDVGLELVVVDDGSVDDTRDVVDALRDPRVVYHYQDNQGLSAARNAGAHVSRGQFLVFLDDDDALLPGCLAAAFGCAESNDAAVVTWGADVIDGDGSLVEQLRPEDLGPAFFDYRALFRAGTFAVDRALFEHIGGFDTGLRANHQTELALRLLAVCHERSAVVAALDRSLTRIRRRDATARGRNDPERLFVATDRILERHRSQLERSPQLLSDYLGVAGVAAARASRWSDARERFADAARVAPGVRGTWTQRARWAVTSMPPVARRAWRVRRYEAVHDTVSEPGALIVYRGPWQGRRVRFLLDAFHQCFGDVDFVWVNPRFDPAGDRAWAHSLCSERPYVSSAQEIDGKLSAFVPTCARLARDFRRGRLVCGIGFTAVLYARALRPARIVWAVNGIPEERLLYDRGLVSRTAVEAAWLLARLGRKPDAAVVVSGPMGRHVSDRMGGALPWAKAPTSVDIAVFDQPSAPVRSWFTYVGSGAPWQGIDLLARVWKEVARIDPTARFRVVSRDDRAKLLLAGIPDDRGEMVEARAPAQVAGFLSEALLGFLIRKRDIVNETSFPTKFGEYLAAGVPVVTTDIGWEIADIVRDADCGLLVDPEASPELVADQIVRYADAVRCDRDASERCTRASVSLSRDAWLDSLVADLGEIL